MCELTLDALDKQFRREFRISQPIKASPDPLEATVIARAQSLLTRDGKRGPVLTYDEALRVIEETE